MALSKRVGYGATLGVDVSGGSSYSDLAAIVDGISGPDSARDDIETTVLADVYKTFAPGQVDGGTVSYQIAYDPADAVTTHVLVGLLTQKTPVPSWQITFPVSASTTETVEVETFSAYLQGIGKEVTKDALITSEITLKITGDPGFSAS